jgi:hypothetical protein
VKQPQDEQKHTSSGNHPMEDLIRQVGDEALRRVLDKAHSSIKSKAPTAPAKESRDAAQG